MARLLSHSFNLSYKNYISTGFGLNKQYSVLCGCYRNNNDRFRENKNLPYQKIQHRNFGEGVVQFMNNLSNSQACSVIRVNLLNFHEMSGLPWWATIVLTTGAVRLSLTFVTGIFQEKTHTELWSLIKSAKQRLKDDDKEALALAKKNNWTLEKTLKFINSQKKEKKKKENERRTLLAFRNVVMTMGQIGVWVMLSLSLNGLTRYALEHYSDAAELLTKQLSSEGTLWFKNLLKPDNYYILSGCLVGINFLISEICDLQHGLKTRFVSYLVRGLVLWLGYISSMMPASITLFWVASSFVALLQNLFFLSPRVRKFFRIGTLNVDDPHHPYKMLWKRFKIKWRIA